MTTLGWATCPDEIKTQITSLAGGFRNVLGENLAGTYLHGSLAMNCYNPKRSDVDLLVVVDSTLTVQAKRNLSLLLIKISRNPATIEVNFIARSIFDPWQYPTPFEFRYSEDWRRAVQQSLLDGGALWTGSENRGLDLPAHITVARRRGVSLYGPEPAKMFPAIPEEDYVDSLLQTIYNEKIGLTLNSEKPVDAILLACNAYAHTRTDVIYSKAEAGEWAVHGLPNRYHPLVQAALDCYRGDADDHTFPRAGLPEFIEFMKADFERFNALTTGQDASRG
jgi:streptomycin 3"-adenylyltransferase